MTNYRRLMNINCVYCGRPAIYVRKYSGEALCKSHFTRSIEKKFLRTIRKYLRHDIKIGLDISDNMDSLVMIYIARKVIKDPKSNLLGILIEDTKMSDKYTEELLRKLNIKYIVASFKEFYGATSNEIIGKLKRFKEAYMYYKILRERMLDIIGAAFNLDYIFIGLNAYGVAERFLYNMLFRGLRDAFLHNEYENLVTRVYPLKYIREEEITIYADLVNIKYHYSEKSHKHGLLKSEIREFIEKIDKERPGTVYNIIHMEDRIYSLINSVKIRKCIYCGFPSKREKCRVCETLLKLDLKDRIIKLTDSKKIKIRISG